jgi:hypothetical protein
MKQNTVYYLFALLFFPKPSLSNHRWWSEIKKMITEVKAESLKYTVEKLVSFELDILKRYKE